MDRRPEHFHQRPGGRGSGSGGRGNGQHQERVPPVDQYDRRAPVDYEYDRRPPPEEYDHRRALQQPYDSDRREWTSQHDYDARPQGFSERRPHETEQRQARPVDMARRPSQDYPRNRTPPRQQQPQYSRAYDDHGPVERPGPGTDGGRGGWKGPRAPRDEYASRRDAPEGPPYSDAHYQQAPPPSQQPPQPVMAPAPARRRGQVIGTAAEKKAEQEAKLHAKLMEEKRKLQGHAVPAACQQKQQQLDFKSAEEVIRHKQRLGLIEVDGVEAGEVGEPGGHEADGDHGKRHTAGGGEANADENVDGEPMDDEDELCYEEDASLDDILALNDDDEPAPAAISATGAIGSEDRYDPETAAAAYDDDQVSGGSGGGGHNDGEAVAFGSPEAEAGTFDTTAEAEGFAFDEPDNGGALDRDGGALDDDGGALDDDGDAPDHDDVNPVEDGAARGGPDVGDGSDAGPVMVDDMGRDIRPRSGEEGPAVGGTESPVFVPSRAAAAAVEPARVEERPRRSNGFSQAPTTTGSGEAPKHAHVAVQPPRGGRETSTLRVPAAPLPTSAGAPPGGFKLRVGGAGLNPSRLTERADPRLEVRQLPPREPVREYRDSRDWDNREPPSNHDSYRRDPPSNESYRRESMPSTEPYRREPMSSNEPYRREPPPSHEEPLRRDQMMRERYTEPMWPSRDEPPVPGRHRDDGRDFGRDYPDSFGHPQQAPQSQQWAPSPVKRVDPPMPPRGVPPANAAPFPAGSSNFERAVAARGDRFSSRPGPAPARAPSPEFLPSKLAQAQSQPAAPRRSASPEYVPTFVKTKPAAAPPQAESAAGSGPHKPSKAAGKPARVADPAFPEGGPPPVIPDAAVRLCLKGINFNVDEAMAWEECEKAAGGGPGAILMVEKINPVIFVLVADQAIADKIMSELHGLTDQPKKGGSKNPLVKFKGRLQVQVANERGYESTKGREMKKHRQPGVYESDAPEKKRPRTEEPLEGRHIIVRGGPPDKTDAREILMRAGHAGGHAANTAGSAAPRPPAGPPPANAGAAAAAAKRPKTEPKPQSVEHVVVPTFAEILQRKREAEAKKD